MLLTGAFFMLQTQKDITMDKNPMEKSSGDLGTRASEKVLMKTSAGKKPSMGDAFNSHVPDLSKAMSYCQKNKGSMGGTKNPMDD